MAMKPFDELGLQRIECHLAGDVCHARHEVLQLWWLEGGGGGWIAGGGSGWWYVVVRAVVGRMPPFLFVLPSRDKHS